LLNLSLRLYYVVNQIGLIFFSHYNSLLLRITTHLHLLTHLLTYLYVT